MHYLALREFEKLNGHCNVKRCEIFECNLPDKSIEQVLPNGNYRRKLGAWLHTQKINMRKKILTTERVKLLQDLIDTGK